MSDRVEYIRRRLDGLEAAAKAATPGPWNVDNPRYPGAIYGADGVDVVAGGRWGGEASVFDTDEDALHIALWDPAAVLARVAVDRKLLASHYDYTGVCTRCFDFQNKPVEREPFPCEVVRLMAEGLGWKDGGSEWADR